ncbi:NAD(P)H-binding protein [Methyloprofundus sp.]|uniref:NAD(P)H-binding protein n=1 Tax=Methyloprofundus sp. TaxID=2020875 RepID=UPI003D0A1D8C
MRLCKEHGKIANKIILNLSHRSIYIKTLSILGSGWLGLPLARYFLNIGFQVNASTRSAARFPELKAAGVQPFVIDIDRLDAAAAKFLQANILIINITSKNLASFSQLISLIEQSSIEKVLFVSSTSVYANLNKVVTENEGAELKQSPLWQIENSFRNNLHFSTTVIRLSGLIGYSRHPGRFFRQGKVVDQPEAPVNLIHRDDCIGIISAIIAQDIWGEVFNACADTHPGKREFYTYARKLLDLSPPEFAENTENTYKIVSNEKVKRCLNYQFLHADLMQISFA